MPLPVDRGAAEEEENASEGRCPSESGSEMSSRCSTAEEEENASEGMFPSKSGSEMSSLCSRGLVARAGSARRFGRLEPIQR